MWWINRNGNVEGPLQEGQIEKRIKLNMLRSLDRISDDKTTWCYVKDTAFWNPTSVDNRRISSTSPTPSQMRIHQDTPTERGTSRKGRLSILIATVATVLVGCGILTWFLVKGFSSSSSDSLSSVYRKKQQAIGLVTITFQAKEGGWATVPIGTAFAIGRNKFVTNAHVAYALKNGFEESLVTPILNEYFYEEAQKRRMSVGDYLREIGESGIEQARSGLLAFWKERGVRIRDIGIRLNHSNGKSFRVAKVQVHPRYNPLGEATGEFDVAILEIAGFTECYFDVATKKELYSLQPGTPVASAGFPMEGLQDLNNEKPEASYAAGYIKKVTDFDNKDAGAEYNRSIFHSIPAVGGSSGSPIFNAKGKVVAVLWGGSIQGFDISGSRIGSAALQNFAVRIDQIDDVDDPVSWDDWVNAPTH